MIQSQASNQVAVIAGETSGDFHGAHLVRAMRERDSDLVFWGIGGEKLKAEGMEIVMDAHELSVVGITEVVSKLPKVFEAISDIKRRLRQKPPGLMILIDFPDFNLHIARHAKKNGVPVLYYISPQIWAWRSGRIQTIRRYVDQMAVILPFEADYYEHRNVPVIFVGHPLLDYYQEPGPRLSDEGESSDGLTAVGMLPGSRRGEIEKNLPVMLAAAVRIRAVMPDIEFQISVAPGIDRRWMHEFIRPYGSNCRIKLVSEAVRHVFENSALILAASGTVTLETAIFGVPMIIMYRISPVSYYFGRALINVDHIGLVNIIAGERIVPELIQDAATPSNIAREAVALLNDPEKSDRIRAKLKSVRQLLGTPGAAKRTADIALAMLGEKQNSKDALKDIR